MEIEARYGRPREAAFLADYGPTELASLRQPMRDRSNQEVTLLVRRAGLVAMIRESVFPAGCFRIPSGSPRPGEDLAAAAIREGREQTGLDVRLERYILRAHATFRCAAETVQRVTHVFTAAADRDEIEPRDRGGVAEARWVSAEEYGRMNAHLASVPHPGLRYRAAIQEAAWAAMSDSH